MTNQDMFGYQELLEKDVHLRSCTVTCVSQDCQLITIEKGAVLSIIRRNTSVLDQMKVKWSDFLISRLSNKLYVEKIQCDHSDHNTQSKQLEQMKRDQKKKLAKLRASGSRKRPNTMMSKYGTNFLKHTKEQQNVKDKYITEKNKQHLDAKVTPRR